MHIMGQRMARAGTSAAPASQTCTVLLTTGLHPHAQGCREAGSAFRKQLKQMAGPGTWHWQRKRSLRLPRFHARPMLRSSVGTACPLKQCRQRLLDQIKR